jgi:hypothetical protein
MEKNSEGKPVFTPQSGRDIKIAAANAVVLARTKKQDIILDYNGIQIDVTPNTSIKYIVNMFFSRSAALGFPQLQKTRG